MNKEPNADMKLADFGCCLVVDKDCIGDRVGTKEIVGTVGYIAPEVIEVS